MTSPIFMGKVIAFSIQIGEREQRRLERIERKEVKFVAVDLMEDTIAAIATPLGEGGIAVIRVSGSDAIKASDQIFKGINKLVDCPSHTVQYGWIRDPLTKETVDEVLVTIMRNPRSFTKEDVVEINCHGGMIPVKQVLELLLQQGVRLAEPGEFTKRAFLNGRIDLTQAEAVIDLIRSKSDAAYSIAMKQSEGLLSKQIRALRDILVETMAHIEVNIDYPEHDVEELTARFIQEKCMAAIKEIEQLLKTARQGKVLREGIVTAIVGRPNVGKSSLLNLLAQENKAIVTDIPGTTRDVIEEYVSLNGIPLRLLDTAGLRETEDEVERIGVERSRDALKEADLILLVLNGNEPLNKEEETLLLQLKDRAAIVIVNKIDLDQKLDYSYVKEQITEERIVMMSVKDQQGLNQLEQAISKLFFGGKVSPGDFTYVSNVRHIDLLKQAKISLEEAYEGAEIGVPIDMIQIDVHLAWQHLGEIIGETASETLIDEIFTKFCLGK